MPRGRPRNFGLRGTGPRTPNIRGGCGTYPIARPGSGAHALQVVHLPDREPLDRPSPDAASVDDARRRLREQGIVAIEPDERIGVMLAAGERVVAVRRAISIERRKDVRNPDLGLNGDLYVTTSRLVYLGYVPVEVPLTDIREADVTAGALRLVIGDGRGLEIRAADPQLLRVEISAVREAARTAARWDEAREAQAVAGSPGTPEPGPSEPGPSTP